LTAFGETKPGPPAIISAANESILVRIAALPDNVVSVNVYRSINSGPNLLVANTKSDIQDPGFVGTTTAPIDDTSSPVVKVLGSLNLTLPNNKPHVSVTVGDNTTLPYAEQLYLTGSGNVYLPKINANRTVAVRIIYTDTQSVNLFPAAGDLVNKSSGPLVLNKDFVYLFAPTSAGWVCTVGLLENAQGALTYIARNGSVSRSLSDRAADVVNIMDIIPSRFHAGIVGRSITEDVTTYVQAAIDMMPSGTTFYAPTGLYPITGLLLDGTAGNKTATKLCGDGPNSTHIRKPDNSSLTTDAKRKSNVISALNGDNIVIRDLKVESNFSRGGTTPNNSAPWTSGTLYTYGSVDTVVSTLPNGSTVVGMSAAQSAVVNGGRVFLLLATHTSSANILTDLATGKWREVTNMPYSDMTNTGYTGYYEIDADRVYRHCVYMTGNNAVANNGLIHNVEAFDACYDGISTGSGALLSGNRSPGTNGTKIISCYSHDNQNSQIGGGWAQSRMVQSCITSGGKNASVRFDRGSHNSIMTNCLIRGAPNTSTTDGILIYQSNNICIANVNIIGINTPINSIEATDCEFSNINIPSGNDGFYMSNCNGGSVSNINVSNVTRSGIYLSNCNNITLSSIKSIRCRAFGIYINNCNVINLSSVITRNNYNSGIYLNACKYTTFSSLVTTENNTNASGLATSTTGSGIEINASTSNIFTAVVAVDSRSPRVQNYGICETGATDSNVYMGCILTPNLIAPIVLVGNNSQLIATGGQDALRTFSHAAAKTSLQATTGIPSLRGGAPTLTAVNLPGSALPDMDLALVPAGSGNIMFGTNTASADAPITGYVSIKTLDGTVRKLATI
jgi:hypothetical protein